LIIYHQYPIYQGLVRECQKLSIDLKEFYRQFPVIITYSQRRRDIIPARANNSFLPPLTGLFILRRPSGLLQLLVVGKRDSATPRPRLSLALAQGPAQSPASDPFTSTCFKYDEIKHFASSCSNSRITPRIHEIE
jgi:hypothetical protein